MTKPLLLGPPIGTTLKNLEYAVNKCSDHIVITDAGGVILFANESARHVTGHSPEEIIGRLKAPLLEPDENERDGYVPNVVYTCGAVAHGKWLIMPYAMSDYATRIALVDLDELLHKLVGSS